MKTLFVSDLDGTLLDKNAQLCSATVKNINKLIEKGLFFTVATARSPWSMVLLKDLNINCPAVLMNGVCIYDILSRSIIKTFELNDYIISILLPIIHKLDLSGFLYAAADNTINVYYQNVTTKNAKVFMEHRIRQFGKSFIKTDFSGISVKRPIYYTVSDRYEIVLPLYNYVKNIKGLRAEFYRDIYNDNLWYLELLSDLASKAIAVEYVKQNYGFGRVVAFGDNLNDLPLFACADYCLAVENAHDDVKKHADEIIESNTKNGVAKWLVKNYHKFI